MKKFNIYILLSSFLALLLQGCINEIANETHNGTPLTIQVGTIGYTSADSLQTRTTEDNYTTKFAKGDQIGVFAVKNGSSKVIFKNIPYTYNGSQWTGSEYYYSNTTYFAYYPYDASLSESITTLDGIVAAFKTKLSSTTDQSTYEKYTAVDLMTAEVVSPTSSSLTFTFKHEMALVVIDLPYILYNFTNLNRKDYYVPMPYTTFENIQPYYMRGGTYRYLVAPDATPNFSGSYVTEDYSTKKKYTCNVSAVIGAGSYKRFVVDGANQIDKNHTLQIGDFYMKNGSVLSLTSATEKQKAECIGVVFKVGDTGDDYSSSGIGQKACHGCVVALQECGSKSWGPSGFVVGTVVNHGWMGYHDLLKIEAYVKTSSYTLASFPSTYACRNYTPVAPGFTTGWYLPASTQVHGGFCTSDGNIQTTLKGKISMVGGKAITFSKFYYGTSSEYGVNPANQYMKVGINNWNCENKGSANPVRAVLSF